MGCAATKPEGGSTAVQPPQAPPRRTSGASTGGEIRRRRLVHPSPSPAADSGQPDRRVEAPQSEGSEHNATFGSLTDTACQVSPFGTTHDTGEGAAATPPEFSLAVLRFKPEHIVQSTTEAIDAQDRRRSSADRSEAAGQEARGILTLPEPSPAERGPKSVEHRPLPPISPSTRRSRQFLLNRFNQRALAIANPGGALHSIAGETDQNLQPQPLVFEGQRPRTRSPSTDQGGSPNGSPDERDKITSSPHRPPSTGGYLSIEPEPLWWKARYARERSSTVDRFRRYRERNATESPSEDDPLSAKSNNAELVRGWLRSVETPSPPAEVSEPVMDDDFEVPDASALSPTVTLLPIPTSDTQIP